MGKTCPWMHLDRSHLSLLAIHLSGVLQVWTESVSELTSETLDPVLEQVAELSL